MLAHEFAEGLVKKWKHLLINKRWGGSLASSHSSLGIVEAPGIHHVKVLVSATTLIRPQVFAGERIAEAIA